MMVDVKIEFVVEDYRSEDYDISIEDMVQEWQLLLLYEEHCSKCMGGSSCRRPSAFSPPPYYICRKVYFIFYYIK